MPIIAREMRVSARHAFTYYLRSLGAAALLVTCFFYSLQRGFSPNEGRLLFGAFHLTLFLSIWIIVPLLAADCISRERRDGTLGLLFLTRLRPHDVVVAKGLVHGMRAMTLWLAVLPALMIPFLAGGVGWREAVLSVLVNLSAVCLALASGLLASVSCKRFSSAWLLAIGLAITMLLLTGALAGQLMWMSIGTGKWAQGWVREYSEFVVIDGLRFISSIPWGLQGYSRVISPGQLLLAISELTLISLLVLSLSIMAAGGKISRSWQDQPLSRGQLWFQETFLTPKVWVSFFHRWMRRKLERNPIGWLEQRTWNGRLVTWGWFAVIVSLYTAVLTDKNFFRNYSDMQRMMAWLLAGSVALSAAASFRRERESGVLELLLVSPMNESQIISGRLGGLWNQFLPSFALLLTVWAYFSTLFGDHKDAPVIAFHAITFLTLPVIGLYYSLGARNVVMAFLCTIAVGILLPLLLPTLFWFFWPGSAGTYVETVGQQSGVQTIFAIICWFKLHDRLKRRAFPLDRREA